MKFALATRVLRSLGVVGTLLLVPTLAFAQADLTSLTGSGAPQPITLALSTPYPQPYSTPLLSVQSTAITLSNATLTVYVNGASVYQGNVQPVPIAIGAAGAETDISVTVTSQGASYGAVLSVTPGDVSLVEEPLASAPPLYLGKPLVPQSGEVRLVAVAAFRTAGGSPINPANLSYTWKQGDTTLGSSSGIGKSAIIVNTPLEYRAGDYSVIVATQDGSEVGQGAVSITAMSPSVRIYANDPLLGIRFDHSLAGTYKIAGPEASFYAAPYSFSTANGQPSISWFVGGNASAAGNVVTLRPTGTDAGNSSLSTSVSVGGFENAVANLSLSYGTRTGSGFFGL